MAVPDDLPVGKPQHGRLHYLDNLKAILIILVIFHHAGQPYGSGGGWPIQDSTKTSLLGPYFWLQASFFMGLMFFVSAYFVPPYIDRKGATAFLKDRLVRLGIPLAAFAFGRSLPFLAYYVQTYFGFGEKPSGWTGLRWQDMPLGHLWFVEHLLVYSALYVLLRSFVPSAARTEPRREGTLPGDRYLVAYILAMSAITLLVRVWYPIDRWVGILGFIQSEPAHLPQYLSMFFLGAVAFRRGWMDELPLARGLYWLAIGIAAFVIGRVLPIWAWWGRGPAGVVMTFAEGFVAVGFSVGMVAVFKSALNRTGRVWQVLSANAYAAYLFHVPIVIAIQYALLALPAGPLTKFAIVCLIGVPVTFGVSHLVRKLPRARSIL